MNEIQETAPFYEELKKIRIDKNIEISEIATRTKINLEYLEALELGDYTFLPHIYIRLFMKAYAVEIGVEVDDTLQQLDHFMDKQTPIEKLPLGDEEDDDLVEDFEDSFIPQSASNIPSSLFKVSILIVVVIFGIWVIRQIATEEIGVVDEQVLQEPLSVAPKITDQELNLNFLPSNSNQKLSLETPYRLSISSLRGTWYEFKTDYSDIITSGSIFPDRDISIEFNEYLYLRVERAIDVSVSLNENSLLLSGTPHPTDIMYNGQSKQLTIRSYTPR